VALKVTMKMYGVNYGVARVTFQQRHVKDLNISLPKDTCPHPVQCRNARIPIGVLLDIAACAVRLQHHHLSITPLPIYHIPSGSIGVIRPHGRRLHTVVVRGSIVDKRDPHLAHQLAQREIAGDHVVERVLRIPQPVDVVEDEGHLVEMGHADDVIAAVSQGVEAIAI
jgi:hypothetical protein